MNGPRIYKYFPFHPNRPIGGGNSQTYYTYSEIDSAYRAREFLAVPYEPLCRVVIDPALPDDDIFEEFDGDRQSDKIRRIWAAFSLIGGATEMVTKKIFNPPENSDYDSEEDASGNWSIDHELPTGGTYDEFSSFTRMSIEHDLVINLFRNVGLRTFGEIEGVDWKTLDDLPGLIIHWSGIENFEYSISVLAKCPDGIINGLKFWGVFWKDYKVFDNTVRQIYKPIEIKIPGYPIKKRSNIEDPDDPAYNDFSNFINLKYEELRRTLEAKVSSSLNWLTEYDKRMLPRS